jgi:hypothetical protein
MTRQRPSLTIAAPRRSTPKLPEVNCARGEGALNVPARAGRACVEHVSFFAGQPANVQRSTKQATAIAATCPVGRFYIAAAKIGAFFSKLILPAMRLML